jgi:hypothetical protein
MSRPHPLGRVARVAGLVAPLAILALAGCANDNHLERHNEPPTVEITAPAEGEAFRQGGGLAVLTGVVADGFDPPETLAVTLTVGDADPAPLAADTDGNVASDISVDDLPLGPVVLTLTATDSDGASASDSVTIAVGGPRGAPTVEITLPTDGATYTVGDTVGFQGVASDTTTDAADLALAWSSDLDGPLDGAVSGGGTSALITAGLSVGTHVVTLTATDTDGDVGADTVTVVVEDEVVVVEPGDVVFSEMMVNPQVVDDELGEWVELYNTSGSALDIGGYSLRDDDVDEWVLAGPLVVAAHDYVVLCADIDPGENGGVPCDGYFLRDFRGGGLALANGEDELVLTRPDGLEIDWLHYDDTWYVLAVALGLDPSQLDGTVNDDPTWWCDQVTITPPMTEPGTPGAPNDPCPVE